MQNKITRFLFFFLSFWLIFQFFNQDRTNSPSQDDVVIQSDAKFVVGKEVEIEIKNNGPEALLIENICPQAPLSIEKYQNGEWVLQEAMVDIERCDELSDLSIEVGNKVSFGFGPWNYQLFNEVGRYRIIYEAQIEGREKQYTHEVQIVSASFIRQAWNTLLYKPIFNTLFFLISKMPGHSLGWAIILLTLMIKIILLGPNQKALKAQRKMQVIQPQLDALKEKYKNDPQQLAQETMAIWKKNKVSPMGSCLPMLIQFPILIALFYVVRDGLAVNNPHLFYEPLKDFDVQMINPLFLGLIDLTKKNVIILPLIVAGLQFLQIKLSFGRMKTKVNDSSSPLPMMNQMMQYVMPIMIALFTASLPAAVGFYWGTSTLFTLIQQWVVNKSKL